LAPGRFKLQHQIGGRDEFGLDARLGGGVSDRDSQVRLTDARRTRNTLPIVITRMWSSGIRFTHVAASGSLSLDLTIIAASRI
jgi:hypothetical protein